MESIVSTITEIVPQITYDIIARFVPGTMVILSWAIVYAGTQKAWIQFNDFMAGSQSRIGWSVVFFFLAAYIVSIVLYGIWKLGAALLNCGCAVCQCMTSKLTLLQKIHKEILPYWQRFTRCIRGKQGEDSEHDKKYPSESLMYDAIRVKSPAVGSRIVKLRAEVRQAQVLIVGWVITIILTHSSYIKYPIDKDVLGVALVVSIIGLYLFRWHLKGKYITNIKNHWRILQLDQEPWFNPPPNNQDTQPEHWLVRLCRKLVSST